MQVLDYIKGVILLSAFLCSINLQASTHTGSLVIDLGDGKQVKLYKGSYALVIGVSDYQDKWPDLPGVVADVDAVKTALEKKGFVVKTVLNPDQQQLSTAYEDFIAQYGGDYENRLVFYFAGHGYTMKPKYGGESLGFIVPRDAPHPGEQPEQFKRAALSLQRIEEYALNIDAKHALFLFDSCFSGSIFSVTRALPETISYKTAKPVRMFITSGTENERVPDKSVFRSQFVAALAGEGDVNKDGYLTGTELSGFLQDSVVNYSKNAQHPQYGKIRNPNLDKGDFVFLINADQQLAQAPVTSTSATTRGLEETPGNTENSANTSATAAESDEADRGLEISADDNGNWGMPKGVATDGEEETWSLLTTSATKDELQNFIKFFPNGKYAEQAKRNITDIDNGKETRAISACRVNICSWSCGRINKPPRCYRKPRKPVVVKRLPPRLNLSPCKPGVRYVMPCKPITLTGRPYKPYVPPPQKKKIYKPILTIQPYSPGKTITIPQRPPRYTYKQPSKLYQPRYHRPVYTPPYQKRSRIIEKSPYYQTARYTPKPSYYRKVQNHYGNQYYRTSRFNYGGGYSRYRPGQYSYRALDSEKASLAQVEKDMWQKIMQSQSVEDYETFLTSFPNGQFSYAANIKLARLLDKIWHDLEAIKSRAESAEDKQQAVAKAAQSQSFSDLKAQTESGFEQFIASGGSAVVKQETAEQTTETNPESELLEELMNQIRAYISIRNEHLAAAAPDPKDETAVVNDIENGFKSMVALSDVIHLLDNYHDALSAKGDATVQQWGLNESYFENKVNLAAMKEQGQTRGFLNSFLHLLVNHFTGDDEQTEMMPQQ